jgi:hypothetical protein
MFGITIAGEDFDGRMEQQKGKKKDGGKTTIQELEKRALDKIESATEASVVIKVDEFVRADKSFSKEFKEKVSSLANAKVTRLENEK